MKVGDIVEVILSKDWVMILDIIGDKIICRTKDCQVVAFYRFELQDRKL